MSKTLSILVSIKVTREDADSGQLADAKITATGTVSAIADEHVAVAEHVKWNRNEDVTVDSGGSTTHQGLDEAVIDALERAMNRFPEEQRNIWGA